MIGGTWVPRSRGERCKSPEGRGEKGRQEENRSPREAVPLGTSAPGGGLTGSPAARGGLYPRPTPSPHRLQLGLQGYLIPFAPPAFAPHRRARSSRAPSPLVVLPGLSDFAPTPGVPSASPAPKPGSILPCPRVEPGDFGEDLPGRLRAL